MYYVIATQHTNPYIGDPGGRYVLRLEEAARFDRPGDAFEAIGRMVARQVARRRRTGSYGPVNPDRGYMQYEVIQVMAPVGPPPMRTVNWDEEG